MCLYCGFRYDHGSEMSYEGGDPAYAPPGYLDKASFGWDQAAAHLTRDNGTWGATIGAAATVTFGWRLSKSPYFTGPNGTDATDINDDATFVNGVQTNGFQQIGQGEKDMALQSFSLWADVARITFTGVNLSGYTDNATILIGGYTSHPSQAFAWLPEGLGGNTASNSRQGDVWIDRTRANNLDTDVGAYGSQVMLHEIGHAIGLDHPGNYNGTADFDTQASFLQDNRDYTVMSYFNGNTYDGLSVTQDSIDNDYSAAPMLFDIAAIQRLYGANMTTRIGNTVYGVNSNVVQSSGQGFTTDITDVYNLTSSTQMLRFAIWDAGGIDTLDLSLFTQSTEVTATYDFSLSQPVTRTVVTRDGILIDLRAERFSNAGLGFTHNIAIARGVTIENAISGAGNDTLQGNDVANILTAGSGNDIAFGRLDNDTLYGNDGADTLFGDEGTDILYGGEGNDTLYGGAGFDLLIGGAGADAMDGGDGFDTLAYDGFALAGVNLQMLDATTGKVTGGDGAGDTYANFEEYRGSSYNDTMLGNIGNDRFDGGGGQDYLTGGDGTDDLNGGTGDDTLDSGLGADFVFGGTLNEGSDWAYYRGDTTAIGINLSSVNFFGYVSVSSSGGFAQGDTLFDIENIWAGSGNDSLVGNTRNNVFVGGDGNDTLFGGLGDDTISGGIGADSIDGGDGTDVLSYRGAGSAVTVDRVAGKVTGGGADGGDTFVNMEYYEGTEYDDVYYGNENTDQFSGFDGNDLIFGRSGVDSLLGGEGNDTLDGGAGGDLLQGVGGSDTATYANAGGPVIIDLASVNAGKVTGRGSEAQGDTIVEIENIIGSASADLLIGSTGTNALSGGEGSDTLRGGIGDDSLSGDGGADLVAGERGNDTVLGGTGDDLLFGDRAISASAPIIFKQSATVTSLTDPFDIGHRLSLAADASILDSTTIPHLTVFANANNTIDYYAINVSTVGAILTFDIDNTTVSNDTTLRLFNSEGNQVAYNDDSAITLGAGGSTSGTNSFLQYTVTAPGTYTIQVARYSSGGSVALSAGTQYELQVSVAGDTNSGNDSVSGGDGNDTLDGGLGNDTIDGGLGNDLMVMSASLPLGFATFSGNDTINMATGIANRTLVSGSGIFQQIIFQETTFSVIEIVDANDGNDTVTGSVNADTVFGNSGNDVIYGGGAGDSLDGGEGDDVLDGGAGIDNLTGGDGNDFYYADAADVITESAGALSGFDSVYSSVNFTLSANIEQLLLTTGATVGTGNSANNGLYANLLYAGASLFGLAGDDVLYGSNYADSLDGGANNDVLLAFYSVNGVDTLVGGAGDDVYYLYEEGDVVIELAGIGSGLDTYYTQASVTLGANVEQAVIYGVATVVTGNASNNNLFGNNSSIGLTLDGGAGDDWLIGSNLSDTMLGGANNDILQGLAGTNQMSGGTGDDQYFSASATDVITENFGEGRDTVYANYNVATLAANVEQLVSYGGATIGNGNGLDNTLYGNNNSGGMSLDGGAGADLIFGSNFADTIIGGLGNDTMVGGTGADRFAYTTAGNMGADRITDFDADAAGGQDLIDLTGLGYSFGSNMTVTASGANTLVTFAGGSLASTTLTLTGVAVANVTAADFAL